jgi:hypothetical protein
MRINNSNLQWKYQPPLALAGGSQGGGGSSNQSRITESSMCGHQLFYISKISIWAHLQPKIFINMNNYGWLVKYIKPYIPYFNRQNRCAF